jgi:hypothetical protein
MAERVESFDKTWERLALEMECGAVLQALRGEVRRVDGEANG